MVNNTLTIAKGIHWFLNLHFQGLFGVVNIFADFMILKNEKACFYPVLPEVNLELNCNKDAFFQPIIEAGGDLYRLYKSEMKLNKARFNVLI